MREEDSKVVYVRSLYVSGVCVKKLNTACIKAFSFLTHLEVSSHISTNSMAVIGEIR